ncbi:MAG: hypothetical protein ACSHX8_14210 [Opitutaceae bacterium]
MFSLLLLSGCETKYAIDAEKTFLVISARNSSDVAMTAPAMGAASETHIGAKLVEGASLVWFDGTIYEDWDVEQLRCLPQGMNDPMFEDVYYSQMKGAGGRCVSYNSNGQQVGVVTQVDSQLRLIAAPAGSPVYVLEKPLTQTDAKAFEATLKDMKFDPGPVDGVIDSKTRVAIGFYLEYRGHEYRPLNPAISTALFAELVGRLPE